MEWNYIYVCCFLSFMKLRNRFLDVTGFWQNTFLGSCIFVLIQPCSYFFCCFNRSSTSMNFFVTWIIYHLVETEYNNRKLFSQFSSSFVTFSMRERERDVSISTIGGQPFLFFCFLMNLELLSSWFLLKELFLSNVSSFFTIKYICGI